MKENLKTIALAIVAGITFAAASAETANAANAEGCAVAPSAELSSSEQPVAEKKVKPRRTRRTKRVKASTSDGEGRKKPVRRRRSRKAKNSDLPVTGMPDSAE